MGAFEALTISSHRLCRWYLTSSAGLSFGIGVSKAPHSNAEGLVCREFPHFKVANLNVCTRFEGPCEGSFRKAATGYFQIMPNGSIRAAGSICRSEPQAEL